MFLLGYAHALRASEIASLTLEDVRNGRIRCARGKGSQHTVEELRENQNTLLDEKMALAAWLRERGDADGSAFLFTSRQGSCLKRKQVYNLFRKCAELAGIEADMTRRGDTEWARVVAIKQQAVTAWAELAAGDTAQALRDAKAAADLEDVTEKQPVTPAELLPARELEADMLLATGRYAQARAAYETTLTREPRRARSLFGSARAAELAGDTAGARRRYDEYLAQMQSGDGDRAEIAQARAAVR